MSDDKEDKKLRIETAHAVGKPLPPRTIAAQSQARNSITKIWVLGIAIGGFMILSGIALFVRPEIARDMAWAAVALAAYLAGSGEFSRKEEK